MAGFQCWLQFKYTVEMLLSYNVTFPQHITSSHCVIIVTLLIIFSNQSTLSSVLMHILTWYFCTTLL